MTDIEIIEGIAQFLYEQDFSVGYWHTRMSKGDKVKWLVRAKQLFSYLRDKGLLKPSEPPLLNDKEMLAAPSGEIIYKEDKSVDIRATRLNREREIAKAQLRKCGYEVKLCSLKQT